MAEAYLALGGNVGDTRSCFHKALELLARLGTVEKVSSLYKTEPVGFADQQWFLNAALVLQTDLPPQELLRKVKAIETELGRSKGVVNGPREIDIDILLYDGAVLKEEGLTIPHPRMHERLFVLAPLSEIAPETMHPVFAKTIRTLLNETTDTHACQKLPPEASFPS